ncbi:hypothetical protein PS910_04343 [Pseudomonas fluorescens]|nr:hypothetical protein PS910_04343 [Pseudomonas fluorescens]
MEFEVAKSQLATALRSLPPTGSLGFEGLLRDILVEVTNLGFGLAKSGPQGGSDVRSLGLNLFEVALEAKRYSAGTALQVDALKAKLYESWKSENGTDLWILAATRALSATDNEELTRVGEGIGITVLILDWPPDEMQLPDLAVLCVEAETALTQHLGGCADVSEIVTAIRAHPNHLAAADRLRRRLVAPDIGYAAATHAMTQWMLGGLASDRNAASRLGGKFNNILDPHRGRILRPRYEAQLDQWYASREPCVLLGDEGLGKTWLFLSWWQARTEAEADLPITLFVPAKEVGQESLDELIARLLKKHLGHRSLEFWHRRITQWLKMRPDGPQILLVIDGLNQHWQKRDWTDLLQRAFDDHWNSRISILMSCWPGHWNELQRLASLTPRPTEIKVERFDDSELDELLGAHGLRRESFGNAMLELMKVPRLSTLAIARQRDLIASGDITPERLAVEDWKHRIELRGAQLALSDAEFQCFVAELGMQVRSSIDGTVLTRKNVLERLGRDSGKDRLDLHSTVAELISGQWLIPTGQAHQFRVNPELVPFALGLALVHQVKSTSDEAAANISIAEHIDPFSGQSLGVHILRAAVTAALLDDTVSRPARRALLIRWITEQNFSRLDFEAFWRIIGLDIDLILQIIEESWLGEGIGAISTDEIMIKGLTNAYQFDAVAPLIELRVARWLGWFWEDPFQGNVLGRIDLTSQDSRQRQEVTAENLDSWQQFEGRDAFPRIELCGSGNPSWLSHRVFGIISFLPRARFIEAIAAWGISRAVMGMPQHFDELAWTLRLKRENPEETRNEVMNLVDRLVESGHRLALDAACWLLKALADPQAENRLRHLRPLIEPGSNRRAPLSFSPSEEDIFNPTVEVDLAKIQDAVSTPLADIELKFASSPKLLVLARTNPSRLREVIREKAMSAASLAPAALRQLLDRVDGFLAVLSDEERGVLEAAIDAVLENSLAELPKQLEWWRVRRLELRLAGSSGLAQLELILKEVGDPKLVASLRVGLLDFTQDQISSVLGRFEIEDDRETVLGWLTLLVEVADHRSIDGWSKLPALLSHSDPQIAELSIALVSHSTDPAALEVIALSSWTATEVTDRRERYNRSVALLKASQVLNRPELLERADREVMAVWLQSEPDNPYAIQAYESFIRDTLGRLQSRNRRSVQPLIAHRRAVAILLDRADEDFWIWLNQALANETTISNFDLMDEFPLLVLAEALMSRRPELGLMLWDNLKEAMHDGIVKITGLITLPFMASCDSADAARNGALANAVNDQELFDLVRQAGKCGQMAWLVGKALELARSEEAEALAMSITLLGFTDECEIVETAWAEIDKRVPFGGWLEKVYWTSRRTYERNCWARHWYSRYLQVPTDDEAIAALLLLGAAIDMRAVHRFDQLRISELAAPRRKFWALNRESLNAASKKRRDKLKDTLFWTKTMKQTHWPWI